MEYSLNRNMILNMKKITKKIINKFLGYFNLKLIKNSESKNQDFPIEANQDIKKFIKLSTQFSMTGKKRMYALFQAIENSRNLEGDYVECGVWRGGNILLYKLLADYYNLKKTIYAFDTFEGMTAPENIDVNYQGHTAQKSMGEASKNEKEMNIHCYSSIDMVKKNILKHSNLNNIKFIKGPVEETLLNEKNLPNKISVLRLDTDFYSSTKIELEILYPKLISGGVLIIDDYGYWRGARKAVDEYFNQKKWLHIVDQTCRYLIKD